MAGLGVPIPYIYEIEMMGPGDTKFRKETRWTVSRGDAPFIKFTVQPISGSTIRVSGFGPFTHLASIASTLSLSFPANAEGLLPLYAASVLLASGEAGRVRTDVGVLDAREQANRVGSSMAASDKLLQRFYKRLSDAAMAPMGRHVIPVF
jgi:hypothetical protein